MTGELYRPQRLKGTTSRAQPPWRARNRQVVADRALVCQEFGGHDGADGVPTEVLGSGRTAAVTIEAGKRIGATLFQGAAQHIAIGHGPKCLSCASHAVGPIS